MSVSVVGALLVLVGFTMTAVSPLILARPEFVSRQPMGAMQAWVVTAVISAGATISGLLLMMGSALTHHVVHEPGNASISATVETIAGWIAVAIIGILAFRAGVAISELKADQDDDRRAIATLVLSASPIQLGRIRALQLDSNQPFIVALPRLHQVVLSRGLTDFLNSEQLVAAAEHEQAHLDRHHTRLLSLGRIASSSAPFVPASNHMFQVMRIATELDADDIAARRCGYEAVSQALGLTYPDEPGVAERVQRLLALGVSNRK